MPRWGYIRKYGLLGANVRKQSNPPTNTSLSPCLQVIMAETSLLEAGASAASTAAALENLQVEASCSVCLEYLKEPVIIECGHNFCKACITRWWEDLERDFPCPVCRKTSRYRSLRPNRQLGSMVEIAKQLQTVKRKIRDESLCSQHHEPLSLFCYEDQEAVCLICAISHTHRAHTVVPMDDATQEYKVGNRARDSTRAWVGEAAENMYSLSKATIVPLYFPQNSITGIRYNCQLSTRTVRSAPNFL